jgi:hypothetical protein
MSTRDLPHPPLRGDAQAGCLHQPPAMQHRVDRVLSGGNWPRQRRRMRQPRVVGLITMRPPIWPPHCCDRAACNRSFSTLRVQVGMRRTVGAHPVSTRQRRAPGPGTYGRPGPHAPGGQRQEGHHQPARSSQERQPPASSAGSCKRRWRPPERGAQAPQRILQRKGAGLHGQQQAQAAGGQPPRGAHRSASSPSMASVWPAPHLHGPTRDPERPSRWPCRPPP